MNEDSKNISRTKKRTIIIGLVVLFLSIVIFAFNARWSEQSVVETVSDFYVYFINNEESVQSGNLLSVTERLRSILQSPKMTDTITCGFSSPNEVHIGKGAAFWGVGTVSVSLREATSSREAIVMLKKSKGVWFIDAIACSD